MRKYFAVSTMIVVLVACDKDQGPVPPTTPSPPVVTPPAPSGPAFPLALGYALDTAFQRLAGVRVEVLDGPAAGVSATSGGDGSFRLAVPDGSGFLVRATKADYVTVLESARSYSTPSGKFYTPALFLTPTENAVFEPGTYSVTLDFPCSAIPADLSTQTFPATVTRLTGTTTPPGRGFNVQIDDDRFRLKRFVFGVAGQSVGVQDGELVWEVRPYRYFHAFFGQDWGGEAVPAGVSSFSIPAKADFCELNSPMGSELYCDTSPAAQVITRGSCLGGRLTLTPR